MKKCTYCDKEFEPKNPKGRFCSDKCRVYDSRLKKVKIADIGKECGSSISDTDLLKMAQKAIPSGSKGNLENDVYKIDAVEIHENKDEIMNQITAIRNEKIPDHRNNSNMGRKSWAWEQKQKIDNLYKQLK